jgi:outer membrane protein
MRFILKTAFACAALIAASGAFAQKAGDDILSVGIASVNPDATLSPMSSTEPHVKGALTGSTATAGSATTLSLGWLHMYTDNIGVEGTIGIPPKISMDLYTPATTLKNHPEGASAKVLTPTVIAKYFFNTPQDKVRPYVGLGMSRIMFQSVSAKTSDPEIAAIANTSSSLSSSWAPVYNAGVIYNIDDRWSINGSVTYIPITTTATFSGPGVGAGAAVSTGDLKLNTTDYVIRVGYRF